jgi:hypothetical protein
MADFIIFCASALVVITATCSTVVVASAMICTTVRIVVKIVKDR